MRKKIVVTFDSSGELMILCNSKTGALYKTGRREIFEHYKNKFVRGYDENEYKYSIYLGMLLMNNPQLQFRYR